MKKIIIIIYLTKRKQCFLSVPEFTWIQNIDRFLARLVNTALSLKMLISVKRTKDLFKKIKQI